MIFVQGDTTTVLVASLVAFYHKVKVAHIEAGLRSFDKYSPFPEETNRVIVSQIAYVHFAPTEIAVQNLLKQNIHQNVYITGNSVIDALHLCLSIIQKTGEGPYLRFFNFLDFSQKIILLTCHRRESFGKGVEDIFKAVKQFALQYTDVQIVYPLHPNPNVQGIAYKLLSEIKNVKLIPALDYPHLIWLMSKCYFVVTDSGGIQEEAPALGKPVLVLREVTERVEAVMAGTAKLVGTSPEKIFNEMNKLLNNKNYYKKFSKAHNPYGDGTTAKRIVEILKYV
jgi:UDP-N-acetylglucosamine 2-epimerase